jgi:hypothetical protein
MTKPRMIIEAIANTDFADLSLELLQWTKANGFKYRSVYSIVREEKLTKVQRRWLDTFMRRWERRLG